MRVIIIFIIVANTNENKLLTMKRIIFICSLLFLNVEYVISQATDFTTNDCNGVTHNLYDSLDAGNVIVISWVMPCSPCATYSLPAYSAVESFATSHPGRVHFYMADDYANTTCLSLSSWGDNYNMMNSTYFSTSDVNMNGYGVAGMPKVVVLGGQDHTVFYNKNDANINFNDVQTAISNALGSFVGTNELSSIDFKITSFPNPTVDFLNISYVVKQNEKILFKIINILGEIILVENDNSLNIPGVYNKTINISSLSEGSYFLNVSTSSHSKTLKFVVAY